MTEENINQLISSIKLRERHAKIRGILIILIPCIGALFLIDFTTNKINTADKQLQTIDKLTTQSQLVLAKTTADLKRSDSINKTLTFKNDSLSKILIESVTNLGKAVSITSEFKSFIDKIRPSLRTQEEASFYINFRMMEDKIRGNYNTLAEKTSQLPNIDDNKTWITILESSTSLDDLKKDADKFITIYGRDQVAIYQDGKNFYALNVKGNGTFTRAYRLNVELRDKFGITGSYFSCSNDWGTDYIK